MTIALIGGAASAGTRTTSLTTSGTIDTTTGTDRALFIAAARHIGGGAASIADLQGNGWAANGSPTAEETGLDPASRLHWSIPTSFSGVHSGSVSGTSTFPGIVFAGFTGILQTNPLSGTPTHTSGNANTIQPGSQTPSVDNCLLLSWCGYNGTQPLTISGTGWAIIAQCILDTGFGIGLAYKIQTTAGAENPTWGLASGGPQDFTTGMSIFLPSVGGGGGGLFVNPLNGIGGGAAMPIA